MLNSKKLWFTMLNFSNDTVESTYGIDLIKSILEEYEYIKYYSPFSLDYTKPKISDLDLPLVFTFSLSEHGDMLSQWRGYCPNGGYSIRFYQEQLDVMMKENDMIIGKCIYNTDDQKEFIRKNIITLSVDQFKDKWNYYRQGIHNRWFEGFQLEVNQRIRRYAPLIKHYKFEEEAEWKIITDYTPSSSSLTGGLQSQRQYMKLSNLLMKGILEFREGKSTLIPYLNMQLAKDEKSVHIPELIISPTPHKGLALVAAQFLLDKHETSSLTFKLNEDTSGVVRNSDIPYRHW